MLYAFFLVSCNTHPKSTRQLSVAIAGTESYISAVLQPYVEHFASKPSDWQNFLRFLVIPLGKLIQLPFLKGNTDGLKFVCDRLSLPHGCSIYLFCTSWQVTWINLFSLCPFLLEQPFFSILRFHFKARYTCAYRVSILGHKFSFLVPYVSISLIRENLFKYFRECILGDQRLNFHNLYGWITVGAWRVNPIFLWFTDSQPLAKYIASLDPRYSSLFMDNVWKEAFEHSDTTVGESVAYFFCLLIMKSDYFVMIVYYSAAGASDQLVRPAIRCFLSDH